MPVSGSTCCQPGHINQAHGSQWPVETDSSGATTERRSRVHLLAHSPDGTTEYIYEDLSIRIDLVLTNTRFAFKLMNLMPDTLLIDWEKAMYINQRNDTLRVIHNGVDLAQRAMLQDTTFLAPGALLDDFLLPVDNVIDDPTNFSLWKINYLFYEKKENIGQKVSVMLPLETKEGEKRYHFFFVIDNWKDV